MSWSSSVKKGGSITATVKTIASILASAAFEKPVIRYGLGLALTGLALALRLALLPMEAGFGFLTFYPATILSVLLLGIGPAILAIVISAMAGFYLFIPPVMEFKFSVPAIVTVATFVCSGALICWIVHKSRKSERKLSMLASLIESSGDAIVSKTLQGTITSWNPEAERLFGYTVAEAIGRPMTMVFPPNRLREEDDLLARIIDGETISPYETVRVHKDGTLLDLSVTLSPIRNSYGRIIGVSKIAHDISRRKRVDALLQAERQLLQTTLDALTDHVCVIDQTGKILSINQSWIEFAQQNGGFKDSMNVGANYLEICNKASSQARDEAGSIARGIRAVINGEMHHFQIEYMCDSTTQKRWFTLNVLRANSSLIRVVLAHQDITKTKNLEAQLQDMAFHDPLTHLPNRRLLLDRLTKALSASKRHNSHLALLFMDLNKFKQLNDAHGHDAGDQLLIEVGHRLGKLIRDTDTIARIGGDEFVVLLEGLGPSAQDALSLAQSIAEKIMLSLGQEYKLGAIHHQCSASLGIKLALGDGSDPDQILKEADQAMYAAKRCQEG